MGIFVAATVQCGPTLTSFIMMNMIVVPFFAANWEESITHVMRFGMVGVTEGQFIVMGVELFTGLLGADVWFTRIFPDILGIDMVTSFDLFTLVIGVSAIGATYQCVSSVYTVFKFYRQHPEESREQGIVSFIQFFVVLGFGFAWVLAPSGFYPSHPRIILTVTGMLASYQASRLIVCHTTGEPFPWCFVVCFPFPFVVLNEWSGRWFGKHDQDVYFPSFYVGWAYGVFIAVLYAHFIVVTIDQITTFLGIKCFKIKPKVRSVRGVRLYKPVFAADVLCWLRGLSRLLSRLLLSIGMHWMQSSLTSTPKCTERRRKRHKKEREVERLQRSQLSDVTAMLSLICTCTL